MTAYQIDADSKSEQNHVSGRWKFKKSTF